jgi:Fe-S-cluster containining protein
MTKWKCNMCGECCRHVDRVPALREFAKEDGSCSFLEGNKCSIYDHRPLVCNVRGIYERFFKGQVPEDLFYEKTAQACAELQKGIVSDHEHNEPG